MKEGEVIVQNNQNFFSLLANLFKKHEKQITSLMVFILTTVLFWIVSAGMKGVFGYNLVLTMLICSFPGAMFGVMRFNYTFKEIIAGIISGSVSAIASLAIFALLVTVDLLFFEVENIVLVSSFGVWWILTTIGRAIYRNYENYFIPFFLFISILSVWTIFFYR